MKFAAFVLLALSAACLETSAGLAQQVASPPVAAVPLPASPPAPVLAAPPEAPTLAPAPVHTRSLKKSPLLPPRLPRLRNRSPALPMSSLADCPAINRRPPSKNNRSSVKAQLALHRARYAPRSWRAPLSRAATCSENSAKWPLHLQIRIVNHCRAPCLNDIKGVGDEAHEG